MPDGKEPYKLIQKWGPFIDDFEMLIDSDVTFRHWKYAGAYADQPFYDICVYRVIRNKWVQMKNQDMTNKMKAGKKNNIGKGRKRKWRSR